ncbi:LysR substrate-binding domain-containing protein [Streptomyces sp. 2131.1]|uniref:LysR substrate-binding domain-containing protein n=1 Tax=Streptomyces sp. 2131.1 TaxID=1855346 RepID=UPI002109110B|nr:LysR substrate-binding domain-containing protein [Streptomyces sp. 2131.1]
MRCCVSASPPRGPGNSFLRSAETFLARYPRCTVEPHEVAYHLVVTALQERQIDVAVAVPPVDPTGITVGPVLSRERLALVVPASHALARRGTVSLRTSPTCRWSPPAECPGCGATGCSLPAHLWDCLSSTEAPPSPLSDRSPTRHMPASPTYRSRMPIRSSTR